MAEVSANTVILNEDTWVSIGEQSWDDEMASHEWDAMTQRDHFIEAPEDLPVVDTEAKDVETQRDDSFGLVSEHSNGATSSHESEFGVADQTASDVEVVAAEELIVEDPIANDVSVTHQDEAFKIDSAPSKSIEPAHESSFSMVDDDLLVFGIGQNSAESLEVLDPLSKDMTTEQREFMSVRFLNDWRDISSNTEEVVRVSDGDAATKVFSFGLFEAVSIASEMANEIGLNRLSPIAISEMFNKGLASNHFSDLGVVDVMWRTVAFTRDFEEATAFATELSNDIGKVNDTILNIVERIIVPAWMVIADITATEAAANSEYSHDDFLASIDAAPMPGWTSWRSFMHGDYDYSKAMFRVVVESVSSDRGYIDQCEVAVDVPDVIDKGSARILDAAAQDGVYVEFQREYHVIPEINLTARAGVGSNPVAAELLGSPTLLGFTARLRDTVTGAAVGGSLTWSAIGY